MSRGRLTDYLAHFDNCVDLPEDVNAGANRPNCRPQPGRPITPPPGCDLRVYERYLREKWLCADAIPEVFDPNRLEDRIRASRPSRGGPRENPIANNERQQQQRPLAGRSSSKVEVKKPTLVDLDKPLPSVPCLPTWSQSNGRSAESIASIAKAGDDQLARYASNGAIVETKKTPYARYRADAIIGSGNSPSGVAWAPTAATTTTTTTRDVIERQPTPRIKTGSKPPLSKSAYANASYADSSSRDARGRRPSVSSTARPKAPRYFPFRSQMVAGKK